MLSMAFITFAIHIILVKSVSSAKEMGAGFVMILLPTFSILVFVIVTMIAMLIIVVVSKHNKDTITSALSEPGTGTDSAEAQSPPDPHAHA